MTRVTLTQSARNLINYRDNFLLLFTALKVDSPMSTGSEKTSLSYKDAGVDIDAGNALVERIKGVAKRTARPEVMGGLGGFGALCELPAGYKQPVLVSGTDGVGTKLRLAMDLKSTTPSVST